MDTDCKKFSFGKNNALAFIFASVSSLYICRFFIFQSYLKALYKSPTVFKSFYNYKVGDNAKTAIWPNILQFITGRQTHIQIQTEICFSKTGVKGKCAFVEDVFF